MSETLHCEINRRAAKAAKSTSDILRSLRLDDDGRFVGVSWRAYPDALVEVNLLLAERWSPLYSAAETEAAILLVAAPFVGTGPAARIDEYDLMYRSFREATATLRKVAPDVLRLTCDAYIQQLERIDPVVAAQCDLSFFAAKAPRSSVLTSRARTARAPARRR